MAGAGAGSGCAKPLLAPRGTDRRHRWPECHLASPAKLVMLAGAAMGLRAHKSSNWPRKRGLLLPLQACSACEACWCPCKHAVHARPVAAPASMQCMRGLLLPLQARSACEAYLCPCKRAVHARPAGAPASMQCSS
eukprot:1146811-Pelagomonas_calceolata.AAC.1